MNDREYKTKQSKLHNKRNWPLTIITAALFVFVAIGIVAVWRYVGHDLYIILSVILPSTITALVLLMAALNGRKDIFKTAYEAIIDLIFYWR